MEPQPEREAAFSQEREQAGGTGARVAFFRAPKKECQDKAGLQAGDGSSQKALGEGGAPGAPRAREVALSSLWGPTAGGGGPWTRACLWRDPPAQPVCERPLWMPTGQARTEVAGRTRTSHGGRDRGGGPGGLSQLQQREGAEPWGGGEVGDA